MKNLKIKAVASVKNMDTANERFRTDIRRMKKSVAKMKGPYLFFQTY